MLLILENESECPISHTRPKPHCIATETTRSLRANKQFMQHH